MRSAREIWEAALGELELQINKPNFSTWFETTIGLDYQKNQFTVGVPNAFVAEYLDKNQRSLIEKTLIGFTRGDIQIHFEVNSTHPDSAAERTPRVEASRPGKQTLSRFNPKYTFETFVVGSSNRLAHASALAAAQNPGHSYNPLFFYGGVGLGKTHLLQAIGRMAQTDGLKALYISGEQFTHDFISALRDGQADDFRSKYRSVDLLLFDDIQFIGGKAATEECFFHTFNELHNANRQIVLTSDQPPKALSPMADRLCSRFEWGLVVRVKPPDYKTRLAILQAKAEQAKAQVPPTALEYIAHHVKKNIRELEGSLNRVIAFARLLGATISPELARQALTDIASRASQDAHISPPRLLEVVADSFNLNPTDILGRRRDKETALARQVVMYLLKQQDNCSLAEIGQDLGGRSPSTVSHACEKISSDIENSSYLRRKIEDINDTLHPKSGIRKS